MKITLIVLIVSMLDAGVEPVALPMSDLPKCQQIAAEMNSLMWQAIQDQREPTVLGAVCTPDVGPAPDMAEIE